MPKNIEIEKKYALLNYDHVLKELNSYPKVIINEMQEDIYYHPQHNDYTNKEIVSEWFRLRKTVNNNTLTFKRWLPIGEKIQTHCNEYEVDISDFENMQNIINCIDMVELVRVVKCRNSWLIDDIEVSIDRVEKLGDYIEFESKSKDSNVENMLYKIDVLANNMGFELGEQDRRGYPYRLLELRKRG